MAFDLMGKVPIRFRWTEEENQLEASWTYTPGDPDLRRKLRAMLAFLDEREATTAVPPQVAPVAELISPAPLRAIGAAPAPEIPAQSRANGWEMINE